MLTETEKAYLAGFFDGDGCVNIATRQGKDHASPSHYLQAVFSQCDRPFLDKWCEKVGMGSVHLNHGHSKIPRKKDLWHWRLYDRHAETVLSWMIPYLDIKKPQAELALRFMGTKGTGGPHRLPDTVLRLREYFKETMSDLKRGEAEMPPELAEYERLRNSQLCLFD